MLLRSGAAAPTECQAHQAQSGHQTGGGLGDDAATAAAHGSAAATIQVGRAVVAVVADATC